MRGSGSAWEVSVHVEEWNSWTRRLVRSKCDNWGTAYIQRHSVPRMRDGKCRGVSARAGATLASSRACLSPSTSCSLHRRMPAPIITREMPFAVSIYQVGTVVLKTSRFDAGSRNLIE